MPKAQQQETLENERLTAVVSPDLARRVRLDALDRRVRVGKVIEDILTAHYAKKGGAR